LEKKIKKKTAGIRKVATCTTPDRKNLPKKGSRETKTQEKRECKRRPTKPAVKDYGRKDWKKKSGPPGRGRYLEHLGWKKARKNKSGWNRRRSWRRWQKETYKKKPRTRKGPKLGKKRSEEQKDVTVKKKERRSPTTPTRGQKRKRKPRP